MNKRSMIATVTAVALSAAFVIVACGNRASGQGVGGATKVAVVNVGAVFSKYEKAKMMKLEIENTLKPLKAQAEDLKKVIDGWQAAIAKGNLKPADRETGEKAILEAKHRLEDLDAQARRLVGPKQEEQVITLYKEVCNAISRYAQSNGISLVLAYGDPIDGDPYSFTNINRKMSGMDVGSTTPLYAAPGVEISEPIVQTLNAQYRASGAPVAPATTPGLPPSVPGIPTSGAPR